MSIHRMYGTKDLYLASVLYDSIEDNNLSAVKILLSEKAANPNILVPRKGISPFHLAIGNDAGKFAFDVTSLILQHGGDPNVRSIDGLTPVHIAAAWGRLDILKLLLHCGGDPYFRDSSNMNAIDYAIDQKQSIISLYLSENFSRIDLSVLNNREEVAMCDLVLDKILINNSEATGEYAIDESYKYENAGDLQSLPKTNTEEYVLTWIGNTIMPENEKVDNNDEQTISDPSASDDTEPKIDRFANITRRKKYRKESNCRKDSLNEANIIQNVRNPRKKKLVHHLENSRESGIMTLPDSTYFHMKSFNSSNDAVERICKNSSYSNGLPIVKPKDTSSDYFTCTELSTEISNIFEKNVFEISSDKSIVSLPNSSIFTEDRSVVIKNNKNLHEIAASDIDKTFVSVSEVYKYSDPEENVVLYEKRLLVAAPKNVDDSIISTLTTQSSKVSSLPQNFDYDTDTLRRELSQNGFQPGPITKTTKRLYLKKLYKLKKHPLANPVDHKSKRVYSRELEKTLKYPDWEKDLTSYKNLDLIVANQFSTADPTRKWREGLNKSSFNYLLLDPRITQNLPCRADTLSKEELWETFLSAIFYVGKGKRSRPYAHLYDAIGIWNQGTRNSKQKKIQHILDIWSSNNGVICLHIFQNVIPVEAYTREAAMISAIRLDNLKNIKTGDFYGQAYTWSVSQKCMFGVYLLYRAMNIFLQEGERQLSPTDID